MIDNFQIELDDGRHLHGFLDDRPARCDLVFCHGTPFPAVPWATLQDAAVRHDLRLVAWSRPGYGLSTRQRGRTVASFAADADAVLQQIGSTSAVIMGWSGGGPHALSVAAHLGERCRAVVTVGSVAPTGMADLDWTQGMGPENIEEFEMARRGGSELETYLDAASEELREVTDFDVVDSMAGLISEVDAEALGEADLAAYLASSLRLGVSSGVEGWYEDDVAFMTEWGFLTDEISVPVSLWQGSEDLMVPPAHGRWLAGRLANVSPHVLDGEGHLSLMTRRLDEMLDEALAMAR